MNTKNDYKHVNPRYFLVLSSLSLLSLAYAQPSGDTLSKAEKRFIHPNSKYFCSSYGFGFTSISVDDPNDFLTQGVQMQNNTYVPTFSYEHGIGNNLFAEIGYSRIGQGIFYERKVDQQSFSGYYSLFSSHNIQLGVGYRVINKKNFNFFNLHGGIFVGIANQKIDNLPREYNRVNLDFITNYEYTITSVVSDFQPLAFGAYLGISKEIRLSKDVRMFIKCVQQFGVIPLLSGTFGLSSSQIDFVDEPATYKVRSGGTLITGGLKIQLFRKKYV